MTSSRILAFGLVGAIGFVVDGGLLTFLHLWFGGNVYFLRLCSFLVATASTWYLNRVFTFSNPGRVRGKPKAEYFRYVTVQAGGGLLNLAVFSTVIYLFDWMKNVPVVPLAVGSLVAMLFNYTLSKVLVFGGAASR